MHSLQAVFSLQVAIGGVFLKLKSVPEHGKPGGSFLNRFLGLQEKFLPS
jgi:hypothetical protein